MLHSQLKSTIKLHTEYTSRLCEIETTLCRLQQHTYLQLLHWWAIRNLQADHADCCIAQSHAKTTISLIQEAMELCDDGKYSQAVKVLEDGMTKFKRIIITLDRSGPIASNLHCYSLLFTCRDNTMAKLRSREAVGRSNIWPYHTA